MRSMFILLSSLSTFIAISRVINPYPSTSTSFHLSEESFVVENNFSIVILTIINQCLRLS